MTENNTIYFFSDETQSRYASRFKKREPIVYDSGRKPGANFVTAEKLEILTAELDALCTEYKRNSVLELQRNVQLWAIRYNKLPRVFRPLCLRQFQKYAQRYNAVVCSLFPAYAGTPTPIEEILSIA